MLAATVSIVSAFIAAIGLFIAWRQFREAAFRRGDVLAWAVEVISQLEGLLLVCIHKHHPLLSEEATKTKLAEIGFNTAILVERGRLFFKNEVVDNYGEDKEAAYRGYRPVILDPIVVAHQIAWNWLGETEDAQIRMRLISEDCLKKFVSLAQMEVGRSKTRSANARQSGDGFHLRHLIDSVDAERVERLKNTSRA
jgi:hypothetical protein